MLSERQMLILRMIVDDYVRFAEPVGSRTISKHPGLELSAATIRNEMADLEEMGYLEQPHTSAGRVPSQQGYRFYVDHLMSQEAHLGAEDIRRIKSLFTRRVDEMERLVKQAAVILSSLTRYAGVVLGPSAYETTLRRVQFVPLSDRTAVVLVITSSGQVHNKTINLPDGISGGDVERLFNILNEKLQGTPMYRIRSRIQEEIAQQLARHLEDYEESMRLLDQILVSLSAEADAKVYLGGATHMLEQPEFRDVQKVLPVLTWLESAERVAEALRTDEGGGELRVRIGGENGVLTLQDCSLLTATYQVGGAPLGVIAVIGPTRMDYARVIRLMEVLSRGMTDAAARYFTG